jgi:hypothetical protein
MSKGPETRFINAVNRLLPAEVHREKMHNVYRGGTADVWYSGNLDDLWCEYKYVTKFAKRAPLYLTKLLSPLQQQWLLGRHEEGRNVVVILGTPEGAWICEGDSWREPLHPRIIRAHALSKRDVADYIRRRVRLDDEMANPRNTGQQSDV